MTKDTTKPKGLHINTKKNTVKEVPIYADDKLVATARYDIHSMRTKELLMSIINRSSEAIKELEGIDLEDFDKLSDEDLEQSAELVNKINDSVDKVAKDMEQLAEKVDAIFGDGIYEITTRYGEVGEYLAALLGMAHDDLETERQKNLKPYLKGKDGVL